MPKKSKGSPNRTSTETYFPVPSGARTEFCPSTFRWQGSYFKQEMYRETGNVLPEFLELDFQVQVLKVDLHVKDAGNVLELEPEIVTQGAYYPTN